MRLQIVFTCLNWDKFKIWVTLSTLVLLIGVTNACDSPTFVQIMFCLATGGVIVSSAFCTSYCLITCTLGELPAVCWRTTPMHGRLCPLSIKRLEWLITHKEGHCQDYVTPLPIGGIILCFECCNCTFSLISAEFVCVVLFVFEEVRSESSDGCVIVV